MNHSITETSKYRSSKLVSREILENRQKEFEILSKYDAKGLEISREKKTFSPTTGYPIAIVDKEGKGDSFDYDGTSGNILKRQSIPPGESIEFFYDPKCNQVNKMRVAREGRGSAETVYTFDSKCNLVEARESVGGKESMHLTIKWTSQGKISFITDVLAKKEVAFTYWQYGKPLSITLRNMGTLKVKYSDLGDIEKVDTFPNGTANEKFKNTKQAEVTRLILTEVRSTLDNIFGYLRPSGLSIGF